MLKNILNKYKNRETQEDWLLTYGDMMTLLLCFFIVIVTVSFVDESKYEQVAKNFAKAMGAKEDKIQKVSFDTVKMEIEDIVFKEKLQNQIQVEVTPKGVAINVQGKVFFSSGRSDLSAGAILILHKIAKALRKVPYFITVEGHTDSVPIKSRIFPSNWDLSSARASRVVNFFIKEDIQKSKLKAVGLADTHPLFPETTPDGRYIPANQAKNRRVVILITPY